ncbi:MAG TPA: hypothetical protein VGH27_33735 [Streptosporangiaceae bacterium]|jgi:hypothetical protein
MSESTAAAPGRAQPGRAQPGRAAPSPAAAAWTAPDARRLLQLALAAIWLLDGVLQYQSFMFSRGFAQMLAAGAVGNPAVIAHPITWSAAIIAHHPVPTNAAFATIQLLLGLGIAWRPTIRAALAASIGWSVAVWWFGEGLGGVLIGGASPLNGAPGAVILYALLAVLVWPRDRIAPYVAARATGIRTAQVLWLVLWGSLAYFSLTAVNRAPQALHDAIAGMAAGEPGWLAAIDRGAASLVNQQGLAASIVFAVVLAGIAVSVFGPPTALRAGVIAAVVVALVIWVPGQDLGEILAGGATDVNSGPLLALIALAYWPARAALAPRQAGPAAADLAPADRALHDRALTGEGTPA